MQRELLLEKVTDYCNERGSRTFSLKELKASVNYKDINVGGKTPEATVRRLLQELRNEKKVSFNEKRGSYTLLGQDVLINELVDGSITKIKTGNKNKREYLIETFARNRGWVAEAKKRLGLYCLYPECNNTFKKSDGKPYIEVHHIVPLFEGGEDGVWNLSVVCAHHHRMAHFADTKIRTSIQKILLQKTDAKI